MMLVLATPPSWVIEAGASGSLQHAVADEPVRARRLELRIGAVAIKRAVEFAGQFAHDLQKRCVAFHRYRRQIGPGRAGRRLLLHRALPWLYLYTVKIN